MALKESRILDFFYVYFTYSYIDTDEKKSVGDMERAQPRPSEIITKYDKRLIHQSYQHLCKEIRINF